MTGVERYDPRLVPRLARLSAGSEYDRDELVQAQLRLTGSGYYDSAFIFVDPDGDPDAAPVEVSVREAPLQKVVLGLGFTTDGGPRATVEYTHNRVPGIDWRAVTKLQVEQKNPFLQSEWTETPDERGWRRSVLGRVERLDDDRLITRSERLRAGRFQDGDRIDRNVYVEYTRAIVDNPRNVVLTPLDTGQGSALSFNYIWTGRYFDDLQVPSSGYGLGFELGGGLTLGGTNAPFQRTRAALACGSSAGARPAAVAGRGRRGVCAHVGADSGDADVPHRRRYHGARLQFSRHRRAAGQRRGRPGPLQGGGQRRVAAADHPVQRASTAVSSTRCSSMPARLPTR